MGITYGRKRVRSRPLKCYIRKSKGWPSPCGRGGGDPFARCLRCTWPDVCERPLVPQALEYLSHHTFLFVLPCYVCFISLYSLCICALCGARSGARIKFVAKIQQIFHIRKCFCDFLTQNVILRLFMAFRDADSCFRYLAEREL